MGKVALVIDDALARPDGVQEYVRSLAAYLGARGHEVHVICSGDGGEPPAGVTAVHSLTKNVAVQFNGNGLRTPLPVKRSAVRALLDAERFDVIHVMSPHSPFFAARVVDEARRLQARSVRIVGSFVILPDGATSDLGTRALGAALRRNLRTFDAFTGLSGPACEFAERAYGIPCEISPAPIDVAAVQAQALAKPWAADAASKTVIAFLGRHVERKGVLEFVDALAALEPAVRDRLEVRLGGRGPLLEAVQERIARHGLDGIVRLEGFIADEDKPGFLAAADLAVFPATGGESFGIVLIEAMAAGSGAVLAGDNPGYAWTIGDDDAVIDAKDTAGFSATLARLIADADARAELHARQQERLRDFDLPLVGAQIERLYGFSA